MIAKLKHFFKISVIGGLTVILPVAILLAVFSWLFNFITGLIQPLTDLIVAHSRVKELLADFLGLLIIVLSCFVVGIVVRTGFGRLVHSLIEEKFFKIAPGYNLIKETVLQMLGGKKTFFFESSPGEHLQHRSPDDGFCYGRASGRELYGFCPYRP